MRIPVKLILEKLSAGETFEQILEEHPHLNQEAILASIAFAVETLRTEFIYPILETV